MNINSCIGILALLVALGSFIYTWRSNTKKYELTYQHYNNISKWHAEVIETLIALKCLQPSDYTKKQTLLAKLSAQIEEGRLYFPNIIKDDFGKEKPYAYQGYRNIILDFLVYSYQIFSKENHVQYIKHAETLQRLFTSYIYEYLEPHKLKNKIRKNTDFKEGLDLTIDDFLSKSPEMINMWYEIKN